MSTQEIIAMGQQYVMNTYGRLPMVVVKGEGSFVWDADGNRYWDFVTGIAVNSMGHCPPPVVAALKAQLDQLMHCSNLYWIEPQVKLAKMLVEHSALDKAFFCNSGAEANETAFKLARKYGKRNGQNRYEIISMTESFHGRTLAAITATGQTKYQAGLNPLPTGFKYGPFNDLAGVEQAITPETCAIIVEPVQGEGGVHPASPEFIRGLRQLCDKRDLLLIFDEVQTGIGRTGKLFGYEHFGVEPDIITLAKALGGGFPIGACLAKDKVAAMFQPGDHASTFGGNPMAAVAGIAVLEMLIDGGVMDNAARVGAYFQEKLKEMATEFSFIKEVRGKGMMIGVALSIDGRPIVVSCRERGLLINCVHNDTLRFLPPLIITEKDVDEVMQILKQVFQETEAKA